MISSGGFVAGEVTNGDKRIPPRGIIGEEIYVITAEYDCYDESDQLVHEKDKYETEEALQDFLEYALKTMEIDWKSMRITDSNGEQRVAKIVLERV